MAKLNGIAGEIQTIKFLVEKGDFESAHHIEDQLFRSFIGWLTAESSEPTIETVVDMAKKILKVTEIKYPRWCA